MGNITFGQYFPTKSVVHKLDPRTKILSTIFSIIMIFMCRSAVSLALMILFVTVFIKLSNVPFKMYIKSMKLVMFVVIVTSVLNVFYGKGDPLLKIGFVTITGDGIKNSIFVALRILLLILISSILTFTTSPTDLTDGLSRLLKPLYKLHINIYDFAMMMSISLRFIPTLIEETQKIMNAQKARGADFETGKLKERIKSLIPIIVPLFISSFRRAYDLAMAMECRCYKGGDTRTRMKILKFTKYDYILLLILVLICGLIVLVNMLNLPW